MSDAPGRAPAWCGGAEQATWRPCRHTCNGRQVERSKRALIVHVMLVELVDSPRGRWAREMSRTSSHTFRPAACSYRITARRRALRARGDGQRVSFQRPNVAWVDSGQHAVCCRRLAYLQTHHHRTPATHVAPRRAVPIHSEVAWHRPPASREPAVHGKCPEQTSLRLKIVLTPRSARVKRTLTSSW